MHNRAEMQIEAGLEADGVGRRRFLQYAVAASAAASLPALLAACSDDGDAASSLDQNVGGPLSDDEIPMIGWATEVPITSLDLARDWTDTVQMTADLGLECLMKIGSDLELRPWLATMDQPDPRTLVFTLREGVTFSDGSPLLPRDVVFSWERHLDKALASQLGPYLASLASAKETGPREVTLRLSKPDPTFPLSAAFVHIHSKAHADEVGDRLGSPDGGVLGTGMYTYDKYKPDTGIDCIRNERYWGTKPRIKRIELRVIRNADTQRLALQDGSISGAFNVPLSLARQYAKTPNVRLAQAPSAACSFLVFPVNEKPFDDVHVRRAFSHCIDRVALVDAVLEGGGEPATSISAPNHWKPLVGEAEAERVLAGLPSYDFDLDAARAELEQSSVPDGFSTTTRIPAGNPAWSKLALSVQGNLADIGVEMKVDEVTQDRFDAESLQLTQGLSFQVYLPVYPDPIDYFGILLPSDSPYNMAQYSKPEVDRLLVRQVAASGSERIDLLERIARIAQEDLPYAPIYWPNVTLALSEELGFDDFSQYSTAGPWAASIGRPA